MALDSTGNGCDGFLFTRGQDNWSSTLSTMLVAESPIKSSRQRVGGKGIPKQSFEKLTMETQASNARQKRWKGAGGVSMPRRVPLFTTCYEPKSDIGGTIKKEYSRLPGASGDLERERSGKREAQSHEEGRVCSRMNKDSTWLTDTFTCTHTPLSHCRQYITLRGKWVTGLPAGEGN